MDAVYLYDPAALVAAFRPELFAWKRGAVRVATEGLSRGQTILDAGLAKWIGQEAWPVERPAVRNRRRCCRAVCVCKTAL